MYEHILITVAPDHAPGSGVAVDIAECLRKEGGRITALTVIEDIPPYVAQYLPAGQIEKNRAEAEVSLKAELGGVKGLKAVAVIGQAAASILDYAEVHGVDCIIIASHRPGLSDYFLGSTASRVVRHALCSVHVVR